MCTVQRQSLVAKKQKNSSVPKKKSLVGSTPGDLRPSITLINLIDSLSYIENLKKCFSFQNKPMQPGTPIDDFPGGMSSTIAGLPDNPDNRITGQSRIQNPDSNLV